MSEAQAPLKLNLPVTKRLRFRLIVHAFEGSADFPRVTHIFNGSTREEVRAIYKEHRKQDSFLSACKRGSLKGIPCRVETKWHHLTAEGWRELPKAGSEQAAVER